MVEMVHGTGDLIIDLRKEKREKEREREKETVKEIVETTNSYFCTLKLCLLVFYIGNYILFYIVFPKE